MKRMLSTAVRFRGPLTDIEKLAGKTVALPTESEMRDAIARLVRDLEDMRIARGGWDLVEIVPFRTVVAEDGSIVLRGGLIIRRLD